MIPAYALFRRSTAQQDLSVEAQRAAVRAWAAAHGYRIVREFADDASGLDTDRRREFLALLHVYSQLKFREAAVVLCYDVSRFSRLDPEEAGFHEYSLRRAGVQVIYTHEPGANEAGITGHLIKSLKRVLARDFSHKLSQVVRRGLRAHAALGHWVGGRPPYGYRRAVCQADRTIRLLDAGNWKAKGDSVVLVVDPGEANVVRDQIFTSYTAEGLGVHAVADRLNRQGIPAPASHTRRGIAKWSKGTVWAILRNPIYRGDLVYGKARYRDVGRKRGKLRRPETEHVVAKKAVPAIVSDALWEAAQAKHGKRRFASGRPWHRPYLLSGLVECAHCGKRFQAQRQQRGLIPAYYLCGGYVASGATVCPSPRIPTAYLEDAVVEGIQKRLERVLNREGLKRQLREFLERRALTSVDVPEIQARLRETQRKIGRLVNALAEGDGDLPSVRVALTGLERQREALDRQLADANESRAPDGQAVEQIVQTLLESLDDMRSVLGNGGPEARKAVVRTFLKGITVDAKKRQAVLRWYRLPQPSFVKLVAVGGIEPPTRGL